VPKRSGDRFVSWTGLRVCSRSSRRPTIATSSGTPFGGFLSDRPSARWPINRGVCFWAEVCTLCQPTRNADLDNVSPKHRHDRNNRNGEVIVTLTSANGNARSGQAPRTVVADRRILDGLPWQDKATSTTPGQQERSATAWAAGDHVRTGYWECGTGTFTAEREDLHEICYIVAGRASLRDAEGSITEVASGMVLMLPAGWRGIWEVHEPVEKVFVLVSEGHPSAAHGRTTYKECDS